MNLISHPWHGIPVGEPVEEGFPVFIEVPKGSKNKYELDKSTGLLMLDRVLYGAVHYPANYGFIPRSYCDDKDPLDVLVLGQQAVVPGCFLMARPIGGLRMRDDKGEDDKIIAVHVNDPQYSHIKSLKDVSPALVSEIRHFFENYKTLEQKMVQIDHLFDEKVAIDTIKAALACYQQYIRQEVHHGR